MPSFEPGVMSADEQIHELSRLLTRGLLRWHLRRTADPGHPKPSDPSVSKESQKTLEFPRERWPCVHAG